LVAAGLVAVGLLSISPVSAIVISQDAYAATGNIFSIASPTLFGGTGLGILLPSPFLILCVAYVVLGLVLLALTVRRITRPEPM
jgi:hypothetical protein